MTFLACWIVGAALTYWLAERELPANARPDLLRCGRCGALVTFDEIEHASGFSNAVAAAGGGA